MDNLFNEIIEKFDLRTRNLKIFDYDDQNGNSMSKLQLAYDFYLKKNDNKRNELLFMQFIKKLEKYIKKRKSDQNAQKKRNNSKRVYFFIAVDVKTEELMLMDTTLKGQKNYRSFFGLEAKNDDLAIATFKNLMKQNFQLEISQGEFQKFNQSNPNHNGCFNIPILMFYHFNKSLLLKQLEKIDSKLHLINYKNPIIYLDSKFLAISNYIPYIEYYFKQVLPQQNKIQIRQKSRSAPKMVAFETFWELSDTEDSEIDDIKTQSKIPQTSEVSKTTSEQIGMKKQVELLGRELDQILIRHNLL